MMYNLSGQYKPFWPQNTYYTWYQNYHYNINNNVIYDYALTFFEYLKNLSNSTFIKIIIQHWYNLSIS